MFERRPLQLDPEQPLPALQGRHAYKAPWLLTVEHLQDFCNKCTIIYCTDITTNNFNPIYKFILERWSHGDVHRLDIEFARFFAKMVRIYNVYRGDKIEPPTTQQILKLREALCDASQSAHSTGFVKEENVYHASDGNFIGGHRVEFYSIKPLLRALIVVIDKVIPEDESDFEKQEVRLVRTGAFNGLSQAITFDGLTILDKVNDNEVLTTLPEAVRFIMELDQREEALLEKRDGKILDHFLGLPKVQIKRYASQRNAPPHWIWTAEDKDIPVGPSTDWWKDGIMNDKNEPIPRPPSKKHKDHN